MFALTSHYCSLQLCLVTIQVLFALTSHFCSLQLWQGYYTCLVCSNITLLLTATEPRLLYMSCLLKHHTSAHFNCGKVTIHVVFALTSNFYSLQLCKVTIHVLFALTSHFCSLQLWQGYYTCLVCSNITLLLAATVARLLYMSCFL